MYILNGVYFDEANDDVRGGKIFCSLCGSKGEFEHLKFKNNCLPKCKNHCVTIEVFTDDDAILKLGEGSFQIMNCIFLGARNVVR